VRYLPLAEVRLRHAYYRSGRCLDFALVPGEAGARTAARRRLVVQPLPDGARVLAPVDADDAPLVDLAGATLELELRPTNPDLALFTDLAPLRGVAAPVFVNAGDAAGGELSLVAGDGPRGAFAGVRLGGVAAAWLVGGPARFTLTFAARQARWAYYVVTDAVDGAVELVDVEAASPLVFSTGRDLVAAPDPDDRQAALLAAQHQGARLLRFVTDAPVACAEEPRRRLELRLGGERLPLTIPNPELTSHTSLSVTVDAIPQRHESLFRVVKHLTHSFPPNG
jgi:hypothetical protein